jgi:hypothetical protein
MEWECNKGHRWKAIFGSIKNMQTWCPYCSKQISYTLDDCQKIASDRNGRCLSLEYKNNKTKMEWECSEGHRWKANLMNVIHNNSWCPVCYGCQRKNLEYCKDIAKSKNGKCLSIVYKNAQTRMEWICSEGHKWETCLSSIKNKDTWCPYCSKKKTEQKVREIFESILGKSFPTTRPNFLKNPKTGRNLELDGYCEELGMAFEYDGEQHFKEMDYMGSSLKDIKARDKLKDKLCEEANIILIRVPYWVKDGLRSFILDILFTI